MQKGGALVHEPHRDRHAALGRALADLHAQKAQQFLQAARLRQRRQGIAVNIRCLDIGVPGCTGGVA